MALVNTVMKYRIPWTLNNSALVEMLMAFAEGLSSVAVLVQNVLVMYSSFGTAVA
jgi:hypothetical protein